MEGRIVTMVDFSQGAGAGGVLAAGFVALRGSGRTVSTCLKHKCSFLSFKALAARGVRAALVGQKVVSEPSCSQISQASGDQVQVAREEFVSGGRRRMGTALLEWRTLAGMDDGGELLPMAAAASSECSSGCQSGWTTYLDDDRYSSRSCGTARFHGKAAQQLPYYYCDDYSEEDDLSMISDASSGPRQQCSAGNDVVEAGGSGAAHANSAAERRGRRVAHAASARRQSNKEDAAAAVLLEDTASSPAFFGYSKATSLVGDANGYGDADEPMMEIGNAADFSCAFSATTGFKPPLNGTPLDGYLQMQYSPAAAKPMMPTRQVCRDAGETNRW